MDAHVLHVVLSPSSQTPLLVELPALHDSAPPRAPFEPDMHPLLNVPCHALHDCQAPASLSLLLQSDHDGLRLLVWLALAIRDAPCTTAMLTPAVFSLARHDLEKATNQ